MKSSHVITRRAYILCLALVLGITAVIPIAAGAVGQYAGVISTIDGNPVDADVTEQMISPDGSYIAYATSANNVVSGDSDSSLDIFIYERSSSMTVRFSVAPPDIAGTIANVTLLSISENAQRLLIRVTVYDPDTQQWIGLAYAYDRQTSEYIPVSSSSVAEGRISANGQKVVYTDNSSNVFLKDLTTGSVVQLTDDGSPNPNTHIRISNDGIRVLYEKSPLNRRDLRDLYLYDSVGGITQNLTNGWREFSDTLKSSGADLSGSGRYVSFVQMTRLVEPAYIYVLDTQTGLQQQIATFYPASGLTAVKGTSISYDGRQVAYSMSMDNGSSSQLFMYEKGSYAYARTEICGGIAAEACSLGFYGSAQGYDMALSDDALGLVFRHSVPGSDMGEPYVYSVAPPDTIAPVLSQLTWSQNPKTISDSSQLSVAATDGDGSGVVGGEYFVGDGDPGQGNGTPMDWSGAVLTATFGASLPAGVHKVYVRALDSAGNWSQPVGDYLVIYNPNGPRMTGKRTIVPSIDNGDILPGLVSPGQTDKAIFAFGVKYDGQGQVSPTSNLRFKYATGSHCNGNSPLNCHSLELNATSIAWLTTQGVNHSTGLFQGTASLVVDGQPSVVTFRVIGIDGERLDGVSLDRFQIELFQQGDNPATAAPLYKVNSANITRGNIKIIGGEVAPPSPAS